MTSLSPTICRLCGQAGESAKVWADCGAWAGVGHENCLEAWRGFTRGRLSVAEVGRIVNAETWGRILARSVDGFKLDIPELRPSR